jgi:hypothetical protein
MASVTFPSVLPDAHETASGHRCTTWHNHGASVGMECQHGFALLPHQTLVAKRRADLMPPAGAANA